MPEHPRGNLVAIFGPGGFVADKHAPAKKPPPAPVLPPEVEFADVMRAAGFQFERVHADTDRVQRCADAQDKPNGDTGWYRLWTTGRRPAGAFGTWRMDGYTVWAQGATNGDNTLSFEQRRELEAEIAEHRRVEAAARETRHEHAAHSAASHLADSEDASSHPYLAAKHVRAHAGVVQRNGSLLIPRQDCDGVLWSYHSISSDGKTKKHQAGGRVSGTFFPMGPLEGADIIALAEGYATAATVHEAAGWTTLACLDAGNISKVAAEVRTHFPDAQLVVAVDDDHEKTPNTGANVGEKCAAEFAATIATPSGLLKGESDWNDLAVRLGLDAVRERLEAALGEAEAPYIDVATLASTAPAPLDFVVNPLLVRGYVNALYADGGTGKTTLVQQLATCMSTGRDWIGRAVAPGPVLAVLCEDDEAAVHRRQLDINRYLRGAGLEALTHRHPMHIMPRLAQTSFLARRSKDGVWTTTDFFRQLCRRLERTRYHAVIFDSLADAYPGNEIDRAAVSEFVVNTLAYLAHTYHVAVIYLAHTPKAQGGHSAASYSGSTAWNAKVKSRLLLERTEGMKTHLTLSLEKSNFAALGEPIELRQFAGVIMTAEELPSFVGRDALIPEADQTAAAEDAFMEILRKALEHGQRFSVHTAAPNYAPRAFIKEQRRLGFKFLEPVYADAMHSLLDAGRIANEEYRKRHHQLVIVPAREPWKTPADDAHDDAEPSEEPPE